jgi:RNA polymerase sigma-70 factor, ECF subfamily
MSKELTHIQKLDERTIELLFKTYFKRLVYFAIRYLKDEDTAKEVVHDVFINVWEKRESVDREKSIKSYLYTAVYNRSLNHIRDNKKIDNSLQVDESIVSGSSEFQDIMQENELQSAIEDAVQQLPEKCREVFVMSRYQEMKYAEIGESLNISVKTVEAQVTKALKILRKALSEYMMIFFMFFL